MDQKIRALAFQTGGAWSDCFYNRWTLDWGQGGQEEAEPSRSAPGQTSPLSSWGGRGWTCRGGR